MIYLIPEDLNVCVVFFFIELFVEFICVIQGTEMGIMKDSIIIISRNIGYCFERY